MRHRKAGRKFGRPADHRQALTRNQITELLRHGRITTTEAKAKELRRWAERVVTWSQPNDLTARRKIAIWLTDRDARNKLSACCRECFCTVATPRPGGYTRIIKLGPRMGDAAPMAII